MILIQYHWQSRDYHEKGKKHQQNVQAKISEVSIVDKEECSVIISMSNSNLLAWHFFTLHLCTTLDL